MRLPTAAVDKNARPPESETPYFDIREIVLKSTTLVFTAASLPDDATTCRCLGSAGINLMMQRIQNAIIARGFVTMRVLAEAQNLLIGTLNLAVIQRRIRAIRFNEDSGAHANAWNALPAKPGDLLNLRDIEQDLENLKRVPTAEANIQIVPGDQPGENSLFIAWKQAFPVRLTLSANDGGSKSTKYRSATVSANDLLTLNDFFVSASVTIWAAVTKANVARVGIRCTVRYPCRMPVPLLHWTAAVKNPRSPERRQRPTRNRSRPPSFFFLKTHLAEFTLSNPNHAIR